MRRKRGARALPKGVLYGLIFLTLLGLCKGIVSATMQSELHTRPSVSPAVDLAHEAGEIVFAYPSAVPTQRPETPDITLKVYEHKKKKLCEMLLEEYLLQVVSAEMPSDFEFEALKAQAIAARTYTVKKMRALGGHGCSLHKEADICTDSTHCQAYKTSTAPQSVRNAVLATRGEIITFDGAPIEAYFHSTSGGYTEDVEKVFSQSLPYLRSVASRGEEDAPRYEGEVRLTRRKLVSTLNAQYKKAKLTVAKLEDQLEIQSRSTSGRVEMMRAGGVSIKGTQIRKLLGLNSTNFEVEFDGDLVVFHTLGFGHGVGMSQVGASAMASEGSTYKEILLHYYTGTELSFFADIYPQ